MKKCSDCQTYKNLECFNKNKSHKDGHSNQCKDCRIVYRNNIKIKVKEYNNKFYQNNKDSIKLKTKEYYENNREKYNKYLKLKKQLDVNFKLACLIRIRICKALKNHQKSGSAIKDLGSSIEELKLYLESKFTEGMTWANHGEWHIDHIKPLSKFNLSNKKEFLKACNYTNLQPLWAEDNLKKGAK